jgi:hypothetical protein
MASSRLASSGLYRRTDVLGARTPSATVTARERRYASGTSLWIAQGLLATIFLFAGGMKLALPASALTAQLPFPMLFLKFIGVCEVLGAAGMILPGLLRIRPGLTPLAGVGLVIIMIGATAVTLTSGQIPEAVVPFLVGIVAAYVAYGRLPAVHSLFQ